MELYFIVVCYMVLNYSCDFATFLDMVIIIALIFWSMIWGITGMLLAAPLTAILRILFEQSDTTKPIALLLSGKLHLKN